MANSREEILSLISVRIIDCYMELLTMTHLVVCYSKSWVILHTLGFFFFFFEEDLNLVYETPFHI